MRTPTPTEPTVVHAPTPLRAPADQRTPANVAPLVGGGHLPVLDAFRGLAIVVVLVHNASYVAHGAVDSVPLKLWDVWTGAGWFGVQLFFVLSGLLITGILLDTKGQPGWLRTFYARRVLRIFPLYYAALLAYWVVVPRLVGVPRLAEAQGASPWHYWLYVSNWPVFPEGDPTSLTHFWSLAVEEQFYVFWPLVILVLSPRGLALLAALLCVAAPAFRGLLHAGGLPPEWADAMGYSWTFARMDALAFGALCAVALRSGLARPALARAARRIAAVATLALVLMVLQRRGLHKTGPAVQVVGQTLVAVMSAGVLLALAAAPVDGARWWVARALDRPSLRWLGRYSYGIYVVHVPLHRIGLNLVGERLVTGSATTRLALAVGYVAAIFATSCLAAMGTWRVIEAPFLALKRYVRVEPAR